jgi:hypothetical protein
MFNFNEAIEIALRTWYPKDHELHFNPHHPLGKLLGEWGELLDDYMKSIYKPGYVFQPEDELGDIWYYLRILSYQRNHRLVFVSMEDFYQEKGVEYLISSATNSVAVSFMNLIDHGFYPLFMLDLCYSILLELASNRFDICPEGEENSTLVQLTASNWEKLKPGSKRGEQWARARMRPTYVGGKLAKGD